ncbi:MAG: class I SAM-dependent methyltransferase [Planctomycetota bacterium]|jgi:2-polyprenyl-3-methyl-5-hydroxy-6-metoxy-1,4-benzoquinol methylase
MTDQAQYNPAICCHCGSDKYSLVTAGPIVPMIACAECGLMRQGFLPGTQAQPLEAYAGGKDQYCQQRKDKEAVQVVDYLKIADQLGKFMPEKGRLLEIGCAMGMTLNAFRELEWKVTGVEPEEWSCRLARDKYELDVINSTFQEADLKESSFDVVLLLHVIEHLPNPAKGLSQIARIIRPGGFLVLETPRYDTLWFKLLKGRERSVILGHIYYFTRKTMQALACMSGFEVVQLDSVGRTVTLDRLCYYAAKFLNHDRTTSAIAFLSKTLRLNKMSLHINLHDMMRLYLRKPG